MKTNLQPLGVSLIHVNPYPCGDGTNESLCEIDQFCEASDFAVGMTQSEIIVYLRFINERSLNINSLHGVRRQVTVALVDTTEGTVLAKESLLVYIPGRKIYKDFRADLPLAFANIEFDHSYKIVVRDETSHQVLGEKKFNLFSLAKCDGDPSNFYGVWEGGVTEYMGSELCKSIKAQPYTYHKVQFWLLPEHELIDYLMPELEIRFFFPDGSVVSHFCRPEYDYPSMEYYVETAILCTESNIGVVYAELICMDYAVGGMVFSTDGPAAEGSWVSRDLRVLDEYSLEKATTRLSDALGIDTEPEPPREKEEEEVEEKPIVSDDDLDKMLNEFISSQLDENEEEENEEVKIPEEPEEAKVEEEPISFSLQSALDHLTGITAVKDKLNTYEKVVHFNKIRAERGLPTASLPLHAMFLGSPGTGKTTVAHQIGQMLAQAGVLSKGHVVVRERATLLGPHYSDEENNTKKALEEAEGGILLIDEAYQLYQPNDPRDPGKFVIEALMTALADENKRDWMLILAGYPEEMRSMFEMNPGLKSRIPEANIYVFEDFSEDELMEIAGRYLSDIGYTLSDDAHKALKEKIASEYAMRDKSFGNARFVRTLIQSDILPAMAVRVLSAEDPWAVSVTEIQACDIPSVKVRRETGRMRLGFCA